jgi:hypothetical protein
MFLKDWGKVRLLCGMSDVGLSRSRESKEMDAFVMGRRQME